MPKKQITTISDINYSIEAIVCILNDIIYEECENILTIAFNERSKNKELDVDISEEEEEEEENKNNE